MVTKQLKDACRLTGARWSAWIENTEGIWKVCQASTRSKKWSKTIHSYLHQDQVNVWVSGSLHSGRVRWRDLHKANLQWKDDRIYLFPNTASRHVLLAAGSALDKNSIAIFKLIALHPPVKQLVDQSLYSDFFELNIQNKAGLENRTEKREDQTSRISDPDFPTGITLDEILRHFVSVILCESAFLAIRRGNNLQIRASWKCFPEILGMEIQIQAAPVLGDMLSTHAGVILDRPGINLQPGIPKTIPLEERSMLGLPVTIGQRGIGVFILFSSKESWFREQHLGEATQRANRIAHIIENAILFEEATRYLEQLALLNELASTASAVADINQVSRRVMQRLRRIFNIDWAAVYLLSPDKTSLREYGGRSNHKSPEISVGSGTLLDKAINTGLPVRINNLFIDTTEFGSESFMPLLSNSASELVVPLKYRGQIIGLISLSSIKPNAFSSQDEQLLILIASNLAGMFENMRLNQETQERAEKLQQTLEQLQESQRALIQSEKFAAAGRLMASIAHEINNPLQALQNCLHLVGRSELNSDTRTSYLQLAQSELSRLMNTVQRMLDYYRPGGLDRKPVDIHDLLLKTISLAQKQLDDFGIAIHLDLNQDLPLVFAVGDQLQQVFLNLILNASQAMSAGGSLWIMTQAEKEPMEDSHIEITFKDSGPGIPKDLRATIFEPFTSMREGGLGLGLAVSYGIIAAHDGTLELLDDDQPGACFKISLKPVKNI